MPTDKLICSKCGGESFQFRWTYKDRSELLRLALCHNGWGLQPQDAIIKCSKCGFKSPYEQEDFLKIVEV